MGGIPRAQRKNEVESQAQLEPETEALWQTQEILFVFYLCKSASFFPVACGFLSFVVDVTGKTEAKST